MWSQRSAEYKGTKAVVADVTDEARAPAAGRAPGLSRPAGAGLWTVGPILSTFRRELRQAGVRRLESHFYLSTEWGVAPGTIAVPFYLARADLLALHAEHSGPIEGQDDDDILR